MKAARVWKGGAVLGVAAVVAATIYAKGRPHAGPFVDYRTAVIGRGDIRQLVTASGTVEPVINVQVGSQISGTIEKIFVDYNSLVTNGQVLAQIDPATYQTALHQAEGELANARASLELAEINARRAEELNSSQLIPRSDYDQTVADLHQAQAVVQIRQAMVDKAKVDLGRTTIYSPIDGIVISRDVEVGQTVAASFNTPKLFNIANDLSKMQIHASVSEADIGGVLSAQPVEFTVDAFPARRFSGTVEQVRNAPITNQNVITYTTVIAVDNPEARLKPGMTANVAITLAEASDILKIPNAALRFRPPSAESPLGSAPSAASSANPRSVSPGPRGGGSLSSLTAGSPPGARMGPRSAQEVAASALGTDERRTIYVLEKPATSAGGGPAQLKPVQIRIGITDGAFTEVREGLDEGTPVVVGTVGGTVVAEATATPNNPFAPPRPPRR